MAFEIENKGSGKRGVKVIIGYDVDKPVRGKISNKDTFGVLLRSAASSRGLSATGLKDKGYDPYVGDEGYMFSDNVANALDNHGTDTVTFMPKQKGGSIQDSLSSGLFLWSDTMIYEAVPITTRDNFIKTIKEKTVKELPSNFMAFGDNIHELRSFTLTNKLIDELKTSILLDLSKEYDKSVENLLTTMNELFSEKNSKMLSDNGVYPVIDNKVVYLMRQVLPFEIAARGRTFKFTECTLTCRIWWDGKKFRNGTMYISPRNKRYKHPHVYSDNRLCMGGFGGKGKGLFRVVTILKGAEHILRHGYNPRSPVNDFRRWASRKGGFV